ncbi:MAG: Dabb family protein [Proteobacteria bacterium]|nr:Dabb family protein [Pseudomonadota bacterium]
MITHIVFFKLKVPTPENTKKSAERLRGLDGKIDELKSLEVGIDLIHSERSFDISLTATFDSMQTLQAYKEHPEHVKVADFIKDASVRICSVDYES